MAVRFPFVVAAAVAATPGLIVDRVAAQAELAPLPDPGQSIRRSIAAGERHAYRFTGPASSYLDFHGHPSGADVAVLVRAKDSTSDLTVANDIGVVLQGDWR